MFISFFIGYVPNQNKQVSQVAFETHNVEKSPSFWNEQNITYLEFQNLVLYLKDFR